MTHNQFFILLLLTAMGPRSRDVLLAARNHGATRWDYCRNHDFDKAITHLIDNSWIWPDGSVDTVYSITTTGTRAMAAVMSGATPP